MWVDKPSGLHRGGHTRRTGITRIKSGDTACRQIGETFGLDRVAAPAKGLGCVHPDAAAMRDGVHQGRVVASATTDNEVTYFARQQGNGLSDCGCGEGGMPAVADALDDAGRRLLLDPRSRRCTRLVRDDSMEFSSETRGVGQNYRLWNTYHSSA